MNYATIDDAFTFTRPHLTRNTGTPYPYGKAGHDAVANGPATGRAWLGAVRQAGQRNILIDQDDHTLYYGLHMNQAFFDFIKQNKLDTPDRNRNVDPYLSFPPGLVELKTAWKDIDPQDFPDANNQLGTPNGIVPPPPLPKELQDNGGTQLTWDDNYITTMAWLPYLTQDANGVVHEDADHPVLRKVALVALHSVYTLPGHPEFVWGSIQHVNINAIDPAPVVYAGVNILGAPDSQPDNSGQSGKASLPDPTRSAELESTGGGEHARLALVQGRYFTQGRRPTAHAPRTLISTKRPSRSPGKPNPCTGCSRGRSRTTCNPMARSSRSTATSTTPSRRRSSQGAIDPKVDKRQNYRLVAAVWLDKPNFFSLAYPGPGSRRRAERPIRPPVRFRAG